MNKKYKVRTSSLSKLLQIGKKPDLDENCDINGYFDDQKNYHPDPRYPDYYSLEPWEWTVIPEIVALAKKQGIEIPEDPPFDISKTF